MTNQLIKAISGITLVAWFIISTVSCKDVNIPRLFSQCNEKFATNIYKTMVDSDPSVNIVMSPFSIQIAGALLHSGASGQTAEEMAKGLELLSNERTVVGNAFKNALEAHTKDYLKVANKLYLAKDLQVTPQFHTLAVDDFLSQEEKVDFSKSEETTRKINNWVQNVTNDKIKKIFEEDALDAFTQLALVNAIYFKGTWEIPFEETFKRQFWVNEKTSKEVDMMAVQGDFKIAELEELDASVLQMKYENTDISMLIILPNKKEGLRKLEQKLPQVQLLELLDRLRDSNLDLFLPRFKIEYTSQLDEVLNKMGVEKMFTDGANFSNLVVDKQLKVDKAVHKAFIEVNELGTEAGASTGFSVTFNSIMSEVFNVDHPFMFAIVSKTAVLFLGRYVA